MVAVVVVIGCVERDEDEDEWRGQGECGLKFDVDGGDPKLDRGMKKALRLGVDMSYGGGSFRSRCRPSRESKGHRRHKRDKGQTPTRTSECVSDIRTTAVLKHATIFLILVHALAGQKEKKKKSGGYA